MILVKVWVFFFHFQFLEKNNLKIIFVDLFDRKELFLAYKSIHFRQSHFCIFSKRLTHDFGQKLLFFSFSVFGQNLTIFSTENNPFQVIKICTSDSRIFSYFPKCLNHNFGQKKVFFYYLQFLGKNDLEIMFGNLFDRKELFLGYKNMHFS